MPCTPQVMAAMDVNADGVVSYAEFIPAVLRVMGVQSKGARQAAQGGKGSKKKSVPLVASNYTPKQLRTYLKRLFVAADASGDGVLQPQELRRLLEARHGGERQHRRRRRAL